MLSRGDTAAAALAPTPSALCVRLFSQTLTTASLRAQRSTCKPLCKCRRAGFSGHGCTAHDHESVCVPVPPLCRLLQFFDRAGTDRSLPPHPLQAAPLAGITHP